ncbi:hypothetical protein D3C72_1794310 [compost metagenome]
MFLILSGCGELKAGEDFKLDASATLSEKSEDLKDYISIKDNPEAVKLIKARRESFYEINEENNSVVLIEQDGEICKLLLKDYDGATGYAECSYLK